MTYQFRIASPCSADWNEMKGDDRVRHCEQCNLNVYNFATLSATEIANLVANREGRLCARLYQRPDGRTLTRNCPVGFRGALLRASGFATATLSTLLSLVPVASAQSAQKRNAAAQVQKDPAALFLEIIDPSGAVIPNAQVATKNESTGKESVVRADDSGRARVSGLPKGQYEVVIVSPGFVTKTLAHISLPNPELRRVQLDLGMMGEVVVVGELAPDHRNPVNKLFSKIRRMI